MSEEKDIDWSLIEKEYRTGIKTLRQIASENGVSHVAIQKRAVKEDWPRDLRARIQSKTEEKVNKALVTTVNKSVTKNAKLTEQQIVEVNAELLSRADLVNRSDVTQAINISRSQMSELEMLCDPGFKDKLEALGELLDNSTATRQDKANELYRYIIGLAGRVKLSKEIAAAHGVYIPMQRKILKLDVESDRNQSNLDAFLAKINAASND